jgi:Ino eighty subunit 2
MQLTVKAPPEKLREATSRSSRNVAVNSRDTFQGGEIIAGPRSSRSKKVVVESSTESEEEEEEEEIEVDEEDAEGDEDEDQDMEDEEDDDAEGEEDEDMEDAPASPPVPTNLYHRPGRSTAKPSVKVTPADLVEAKELAMADDPSDDELSDLSEEEEDEELGDDDAEGEEIDDEDGEGEDDSDGTPASISRSNTPDLSKLTRRQRAAYEEHDGSLLALSNGMSTTWLTSGACSCNDRGTKEEAPHRRGARDASRRNGASAQES